MLLISFKVIFSAFHKTDAQRSGACLGCDLRNGLFSIKDKISCEKLLLVVVLFYLEYSSIFLFKIFKKKTKQPIIKRKIPEVKIFNFKSDIYFPGQTKGFKYLQNKFNTPILFKAKLINRTIKLLSTDHFFLIEIKIEIRNAINIPITLEIPVEKVKFHISIVVILYFSEFFITVSIPFLLMISRILKLYNLDNTVAENAKKDVAIK